MLFIRWNITDRSRIVASRCSECERVVGCSHRPELLDIAERAHTGATHPKQPTRALSISTADALLFSVLEPILRSR